MEKRMNILWLKMFLPLKSGHLCRPLQISELTLKETNNSPPFAS